MFKTVLSFAVLALTAFSVNAEENDFYFGLGVGGIEYEESGFSTSLTTLTGRFGYSIMDNLDVEVRLINAGSGSDSGARLSVEWMVSGLAKYKLFMPSDKHVNVHALAGASTVRTSSSNISGGSSVTSSGLSFGVGLDLFVDDDSGINVELIRYMNSDARGEDFTMTSFGVGYIQRF